MLSDYLVLQPVGIEMSKLLVGMYITFAIFLAPTLISLLTVLWNERKKTKMAYRSTVSPLRKSKTTTSRRAA